MAEYCKQCGAQQAENTRFCTECGASLEQAQAAPEYIEEPAASYESYSQPQQEYNRQEPQSAYGQQSYAPPAYAAPAQDSGYGQYAQSAPENTAYANEVPPHPDSPYAPVKMGTWVGVNVLMLIPVVNLIMLIVWACGGSKKVNLKNFARGQLVVMAIQVVLGIIIIVALAAVFSELMYQMGDMWDYFDYMNI